MVHQGRSTFCNVFASLIVLAASALPPILPVMAQIGIVGVLNNIVIPTVSVSLSAETPDSNTNICPGPVIIPDVFIRF